MALVIMCFKQNHIKEITTVCELQLFRDQAAYSDFLCLLKDEVKHLMVYYKVDFVFMYGYVGWMSCYVVILNKVRKQHYLINMFLIFTLVLTLVFDIYENVTLLKTIPFPYTLAEGLPCSFELSKALSGSFFSFIHHTKYVMALLFFLTLLVMYVYSRLRRNKEMI